MSSRGLEVFDKTLQTTNLWLGEIEEKGGIGPDRRVAWHALGAVLRSLRDRLPVNEAAHLGAQLPLLVRGLYYDQWSPARTPEKLRKEEEFLASVAEKLAGTRPVNPKDATTAVFHVLDHYVDPDEIDKVKNVLPQDINRLWQDGSPADA